MSAFKILEPTNIKEHNQSTSQLVSWLWNRLRCAMKYSTVKLMVTGWQSKGKTTLIHRLEHDYNFNENVATEGNFLVFQIHDDIETLVVKKGAGNFSLNMY